MKTSRPLPTSAPAAAGASGGYSPTGGEREGAFGALPPAEPYRRPRVGARGSFAQARANMYEAMHHHGYVQDPEEDPPTVGADSEPHAPVRSTFRDILVGICVIAGGSVVAYYIMQRVKEREEREKAIAKAQDEEYAALLSQAKQAERELAVQALEDV